SRIPSIAGFAGLWYASARLDCDVVISGSENASAHRQYHPCRCGGGARRQSRSSSRSGRSRFLRATWPDLSAKKLSLLVLAACVPIVIYWSTFQTMIGIWSTDSFRHGWVIAPVAGLLLWRDRNTYADVPFTGSVAGIAILGALVGSWMVAATTSV